MYPSEDSALCLAGLPFSYIDTEIGQRMTVYTEYPSGRALYTRDDTSA